MSYNKDPYVPLTRAFTVADVLLATPDKVVDICPRVFVVPVVVLKLPLFVLNVIVTPDMGLPF